MSYKYFLQTILMFGILFSIIPGNATATTAKQVTPYKLGVFPFLPPRQLELIFAPFAASIGEALGREVLFKSSTTYLNFMERADSQKYEIAFVQPFDYVRLADKHNYLPLATRGEKLAAIIVVGPNSKIKTITDLIGKKIALPPAVAAVSRLINELLHENNLIPGKNVFLKHYRSHASCLQQVIIGKADACGSAPPPVQFISEKMKVKFNEVARTREIPHTLFIVHSSIPAKERKIILDTILSWSKPGIGPNLLIRGRMKPFVPITDKEYDVVRKMSVTK